MWYGRSGNRVTKMNWLDRARGLTVYRKKCCVRDMIKTCSQCYYCYHFCFHPYSQKKLIIITLYSKSQFMRQNNLHKLISHMSRLVMWHNKFSENENEAVLAHIPRHWDSRTKKPTISSALCEYRFYVNIGRGVNIGCDRCFYMTCFYIVFSNKVY